MSGSPSDATDRIVSSKQITPATYSWILGAVKSISRYLRKRGASACVRDAMQHAMQPPHSGAARGVRRGGGWAAHLMRFSSVFSTLIPANRFPIVPVLSSAARMPLPGADRAFCQDSYARGHACVKKGPRCG